MLKDVNKISFDHKSSLLLFVVLKLWWVKKLNVHLPWAKTKKESFLEWPFPLIKRKKVLGKNLFTIYWIADWNILRTRMNKMISHLLSEVFSSYSWKITVFPQLALLPLVVMYPVSWIKAEFYPSAPPTPLQKKIIFSICVKDLLTHPWEFLLDSLPSTYKL